MVGGGGPGNEGIVHGKGQVRSGNAQFCPGAAKGGGDSGDVLLRAKIFKPQKLPLFLHSRKGKVLSQEKFTVQGKKSQEVIYLSDKYADTPVTKASKRMLDAAGVRYTQLCPSVKSITLDLVPEEEK